MMKRIVGVFALMALLSNSLCVAQDAAFNRCKLADAKGKQSDATLIFRDAKKALVIRVADRELAAVPYENLDKFSYEYTKKHRVTQGAIVMIASLGAGAVVMLTKSKSHWLYIDYREENTPKTVVLRMDKSDYQKILDAVRTHTGKDVEMLGDGVKEKSRSKTQGQGQTAAAVAPAA
jgi:hypothetical protein